MTWMMKGTTYDSWNHGYGFMQTMQKIFLTKKTLHKYVTYSQVSKSPSKNVTFSWLPCRVSFIFLTLDLVWNTKDQNEQKKVDWVGQLTNLIAKCCKLPSTIPNPKGQVMSTCGQWQGRSCQVQGSRKFSQPNSRQGSGRGLSSETQKNSDKSLTATCSMKNVYCIVQICFLLLFNFLFVFSVSDSNHENCEHGTVKILSPSSPPRHQCAHHL